MNSATKVLTMLLSSKGCIGLALSFAKEASLKS